MGKVNLGSTEQGTKNWGGEQIKSGGWGWLLILRASPTRWELAGKDRYARSTAASEFEVSSEISLEYETGLDDAYSLFGRNAPSTSSSSRGSGCSPIALQRATARGLPAGTGQ
jgi:hypothetical protein